MSRYFVDAVHLIALANPKDQWHNDALRIANSTIKDKLTTTEDVLIEFLNFYSEHGEYMRRKVAEMARSVLVDIRIEVIPRTNNSFHDALELYEARPDKGYSLTDCLSMNVCNSVGIREILTNDYHFKQEGFKILL